MSKKWTVSKIQQLALDVRKEELGLGPFQRLCPYALAKQCGITVFGLDELEAAGCKPESLRYFLVEQPNSWSAALVPVGTGHLIVENTAHGEQRRRSNVAHEMAHVLLEHEFDRVLFSADARGGCRDPESADQEKEAAELGAELLLPWKAALGAATRQMTAEQVAEQYDVSVQLANWRLNGNGARNVAKSRAAKRSRQA